VPGGDVHWPVVHATSSSQDPRTVLVGEERRTPLCAVCVRVARRGRAGCSGGPEVRQALQRSPMPAHACRGHPIKAGARAGHETGGAANRTTLWHVRVAAPVIDERVHLPALIGQRPRLEGLLNRRTLTGCQVLGGLPLPQTIGGLLGSCGGIVRPHRHPVPAPPGGFPLDTRRIETWASHPDVLRHDRCVTLWDVMAFAYFIAVCRSSILAETLGFAVSVSSPQHGKRRV